MGGIISALAEVVELATVAGVSAEAIVSGEAIGLLEAEITSLGITEGVTTREALALMGLPGEGFKNKI